MTKSEVVVALCLLFVSVQVQAESPDALKLWYKQPAAEWTEAKSGNSPAATEVGGGTRRQLAAPFAGPAILRLSQTTSR